MKTSKQLIKFFIWAYLGFGALIVLVVAIACFVLPSFFPQWSISSSTLDVLEKILFCWGVASMPFVKLAQIFLKRGQDDIVA